MQYDLYETNDIIEDGVGNFFRGIWRLEQDGLFSEALSDVRSMLDMLETEKFRLEYLKKMKEESND